MPDLEEVSTRGDELRQRLVEMLSRGMRLDDLYPSISTALAYVESASAAIDRHGMYPTPGRI